jgi:hypothetical protein
MIVRRKRSGTPGGRGPTTWLSPIPDGICVGIYDVTGQDDTIKSPSFILSQGHSHQTLQPSTCPPPQLVMSVYVSSTPSRHRARSYSLTQPMNYPYPATPYAGYSNVGSAYYDTPHWGGSKPYYVAPSDSGRGRSHSRHRHGHSHHRHHSRHRRSHSTTPHRNHHGRVRSLPIRTDVTLYTELFVNFFFSLSA